MSPCNPQARFRLIKAAVLSIGAISVPQTHAGEERFDESFFRTLGGDEHRTPHGLQALQGQRQWAPGKYPVNVYLNGTSVGKHTLTFQQLEGSSQLSACLTAQWLQDAGTLPLGKPDDTCVDLAVAIPGAAQTLHEDTLTLELNIPQAALRRTPIDFIDEQQWDSGIDAATLNYQFAGSQGHREGSGSSSQASLYLQAGVNVADWRLRSSSSFSRSQDSPGRWQRSSTFAQRDLSRHWGTLTLGEYFTSGNVFSSVPYQGIQLTSDIGMLPDSLQGYAPVVRGIAETQAKIEVRQNGYSLYTTYVPAGPFVIEDLTAAGGSGELEIIVTEADGRERRTIQPYATLSNMLRPGVWRHGLTLGRYNTADGAEQPSFVEATLAYGLPRDLTVYGGVQNASFYQAGQIGLGLSLGALGAVSLDLSDARTARPAGGQDQGRSVGWRYGKSFDIGTSLRFAGYRYSTQGYRDFGEAVWQQTPTAAPRGSKRNRIEANLAQTTAFGSLHMSVHQQTYWNSNRQDREVQFGANTYYRGVNYGMYASRSLSDAYRQNTQITLTVSAPLGSSSSATYSASSTGQRGVGHRASLTGQLSDDQRWRYGLDASRSDNGDRSATASATYRAPFATLGTSLTAGPDYRQITATAAGALLAHADGIELGHVLGDTVALVDVNGVAEVGVQNTPTMRTNRHGYALVPYLTPYRSNRIVLNTDHLGAEIDIDNSVALVVPRRGAIIKARFNATRSRKIIAHLLMAGGKAPPFGSQVTDADGTLVGVVGPGGQVLLGVAQQQTLLTTSWGTGPDGQCALRLPEAEPAPDTRYTTHQLLCEPMTAERSDESTQPVQEAST